MSEKIKNKTTIFAVFIAFVISFSTLYIFLEYQYNENYISKEETLFYSQFPNNEKNIFIIGSSHLMALNSIYINDVISEKDIEYKIYNLAKGSDSPKLRMASLDLIISANPEIVFYGIGFRDFPKDPNLGAESLRTYASPPNTIFEPKELIKNQILKPIGFYSIDFNFLDNPKSKTIQEMRKLFIGAIKLTRDTTQIQLFQYLPLWQYEIINNKAIPQFVANNQNEINKKYQNNDLSLKVIIGEKDTDRNIKSLQFMIKKLIENDIKVILFITPYNQVLFDHTLPEERLPFLSTINEISEEFNIPLYSFLELYKNENIWNNFDHIAINKEKYVFEDDFIKLILIEIS